MPDLRHFIMATAGHVDHGKSALVKALTGTDPDRLPEEKTRGITIDLGFAHMEIPAPASGSPAFLLGVVDVPGHEDFVKNMVAGVGSIDLALFVVAADDGWMPQTEEHLQILAYLGVTRAVVALTKIDLTFDEQRAVGAIREKLRETPFADAPIVPTSIVTGRGLDDLQTALARVLSETPAPCDIGKPRLYIDRVFTLRGIGTVVTGTLTGGSLRRGQSVIIQPLGKVVRIRNIQSHNRDVELAVPGARTALNLSDIAGPEDVRRGNVVTLAEFGGPSEIVDVTLEISPRATHAIRNGVQVRVHHASASVGAKVTFFSEKELAVGEQSLAQLKLETGVFVFAGDRFVLRDSAGRKTLAGGLVLDPDQSRKMLRSRSRLSFLRQRAQSPGELLAFVASQITRDRAVRLPQLLLKSRFAAADISDAVSEVAAKGGIVIVGSYAVDADRWRRARQCAAHAIDAQHRMHPELAGLSLSDLRTHLESDLPFSDLFEPLVADLCTNEFVQVGNSISRATHRRALSPQLEAAAITLRATLAAKSFDPPSRKQLAPDSVSQQALRFLIERGEAVEISSEVVMGADGWKRMTDLIRQYIRHKGPVTVGELCQVLICSRRVVVPSLERMDRDGITLRTGDTRTLQPRSS